MKDKVKVIRKSNKVLVKAGMSAQYPITGGVQLVAGGGGGGPRKKQSLPVRILGGAGSLAGGALGALGSLTGRHRSAGGLLQSAISGHAQGKQIGRGLGEKAGGIVGVGAKAAYDMRGSPTQRLNRQFARMPQQGGSRLTYRGQPIGRGGQLPVTGGPSRTTAASTVSNSNANRVLGATKLGNVRVLGPGEQAGQGPFNMNPLDVAVTGNPLDMNAQSESELNRRAINQQMNPKSNQVNVVDNRRQVTLDEPAFHPTIAASPIGQAGMAGAAMVPPLSSATGAPAQLNQGDSMDLQTAFNNVGAGKKDGAVTQGSVKPLERINSPLQGAGLAGTTPSPNQREANKQYRRLQSSISEEALRQPYTYNQGFYDAFGPYDVETGEPMDMAFRLLKMMAFYR